MPVPACPQRPALSPEPGCTMEDPPSTRTEAWAEGLHNANNNASPGGWPGARGGHPLAAFGSPGAKPSYLDRVVQEIVESERTYARDLRSIVEVGARGHTGAHPVDTVWGLGVQWCHRGCPAGLPGQDHRCGGASAATRAGQRALWEHRGHLRAQQVGDQVPLGGDRSATLSHRCGGAVVTLSPLCPPAPSCKTWRAVPMTPWLWPCASSPG